MIPKVPGKLDRGNGRKHSESLKVRLCDWVTRFWYPWWYEPWLHNAWHNSAVEGTCHCSLWDYGIWRCLLGHLRLGPQEGHQVFWTFQQCSRVHHIPLCRHFHLFHSIWGLFDSLLRQWWIQSPHTLVRVYLGKPKHTPGLFHYVCKSRQFTFCIWTRLRLGRSSWAGVAFVIRFLINYLVHFLS